MARRKQKRKRKRKQQKSSSVFGVLAIEGLGAAAFVFLFVQARAERQPEAGIERAGNPVVQEMLQRTPYQDRLAQSNNLDSRDRGSWDGFGSGWNN